MIQWVPVVAEFFYLANSKNPEREPSIDGAPSVEAPTRISHERPFSRKKSETAAKTSEAVDVVSSALEKSIKAFLLLQLHHPQIENRRETESIESHQWYRRTELQKKPMLLFFPPLQIHQCDASVC